jgi:hypothetical protein
VQSQWLRRALAFALVTGALGTIAILACGGPPPESEPTVFSEHRFSRASVATKGYGADCAGAGASACLQNICLHFKPGPGEGWMCSRHCTQSSDCAGVEGAQCRSIYPGGASTLFCVPPQSYEPTR